MKKITDIRRYNPHSVKIKTHTLTCALIMILSFFHSSPSQAINDSNGTNLDKMTISPITASSGPVPTVSLSLSSSSITSNAVTPGETATASTNVTVKITNAASYSLTLKMGSINLVSNGTTITAGNAVADNTWGYKWDNAAVYTAPDAAGNTLIATTTISSDINFTKQLTFGAKFGNNANAGIYHGSGVLSLVAAPKIATITLADLTQMQQLSLAPEACQNTPYLSGKKYSAEYTLTDVRDNAKYTVMKLDDGKCWMTSNLKLQTAEYLENGSANYYADARKLTSISSDVPADWNLPASTTTGFSNNTASNVYINLNNGIYTGYYTWCAATAGTCTSATSSGQNAPSSICPKGWKLPTGGSSGEFKAFTTAAGITGSTAGSTKIRGIPYNFAYTGGVGKGTFYDPSSYQYGSWWSRTAYDSSYAYILYVGSDNVYPADNSDRYSGYAVRCVAQ